MGLLRRIGCDLVLVASSVGRAYADNFRQSNVFGKMAYAVAAPIAYPANVAVHLAALETGDLIPRAITGESRKHFREEVFGRAA